jgi:hypothetical protein
VKDQVVVVAGAGIGRMNEPVVDPEIEGADAISSSRRARTGVAAMNRPFPLTLVIGRRIASAFAE